MQSTTQRFLIDNTIGNPESQSWCPGADENIDLSLVPRTGTAIVFSVEYDTYCPEVFCDTHENCKSCLKRETLSKKM